MYSNEITSFVSVFYRDEYVDWYCLIRVFSCLSETDIYRDERIRAIEDRVNSSVAGQGIGHVNFLSFPPNMHFYNKLSESSFAVKSTEKNSQV